MLFAELSSIHPAFEEMSPNETVLVQRSVLEFSFGRKNNGIEKLKRLATPGSRRFALWLPAICGCDGRRMMEMQSFLARIHRAQSGQAANPIHRHRHWPVVAGVIGRRKFSYDLWGDTVNVASRLAARPARRHHRRYAHLPAPAQSLPVSTTAASGHQRQRRVGLRAAWPRAGDGGRWQGDPPRRERDVCQSRQ